MTNKRNQPDGRVFIDPSVVRAYARERREDFTGGSPLAESARVVLTEIIRLIDGAPEVEPPDSIEPSDIAAYVRVAAALFYEAGISQMYDPASVAAHIHETLGVPVRGGDGHGG